jgi:hypothetical protein
VSEEMEMNTNRGLEPSGSTPSENPNRRYILVAVVLVVVIIVAVVLLITWGIPALKGEEETPTVVTEVKPTATPVPTFTPNPTKAPTNTPVPTLTPKREAPVMLDTDEPAFEFESAGARPGAEWTGFFGQVLDADGNPLPGVSVIVWYRDGTAASDVVQTDETGYYEIHLADAPLTGFWSIQLLTDDWQPASKLFTFQTDENTETGIQQLQVLWRQAP